MSDILVPIGSLSQAVPSQAGIFNTDTDSGVFDSDGRRVWYPETEYKTGE